MFPQPELSGATERFLIDFAKPEWIEWNGGECPLRYGQTFDLRYRDGVENSRPRVANDEWMSPRAWEHQGNALDIVAYRVRG